MKPLTRKDLRKYPKEVADAVLEAVNERGVHYRLIDGSHMRLYNGKRGEPPFQLAASREAKYTLQYLRSWMRKNCRKG